jgi:hypothetical protein
MDEAAWQLECSVEAEVSASFAWGFRTDLRNWNEPAAAFTLDGPFADGMRGTTLMAGHEPVHWVIREVRPETSFLIEVQLDDATLSFLWGFDAISESRRESIEYAARG